MHLSNAQPVFGIWVADAPEPILDALNEAAFEVAPPPLVGHACSASAM